MTGKNGAGVPVSCEAARRNLHRVRRGTKLLQPACYRGSMRGLGVVIVLAGVAAAQTRYASPLIRGVLIERDARATAGQFSVRAADDRVFRYRFDAKTYVERENRLIDVAQLAPGDKVEVLSDEGPASALRYARTIHVIQAPPPMRQLSQGRLRGYRGPADHYEPLATLSFSGVVSRLEADRLVLHTKEAGDQTILLRQDTRFLENGEIVERATLQPNMRVFVSGGRSLYGEVEAYQVIWGEILAPR